MNSIELISSTDVRVYDIVKQRLLNNCNRLKENGFGSHEESFAMGYLLSSFPELGFEISYS